MRIIFTCKNNGYYAFKNSGMCYKTHLLKKTTHTFYWAIYQDTCKWENVA